MAINYWANNVVLSQINKKKLYICAVDESLETDQSYQTSNSIIQRSNNIILVWLSQEWIKQSKLKFNNTSKFYIFCGNSFDEKSVLWEFDNVVNFKKYANKLVEYISD